MFLVLIRAPLAQTFHHLLGEGGGYEPSMCLCVPRLSPLLLVVEKNEKKNIRELGKRTMKLVQSIFR